MIDKKNALNGVKTVVLDLDGTMYDKSGLAARMVRRLFWCLPLVMAERWARRNMHYTQYASQEEYNDAFFHFMARGHWWSAGIAETWYNTVYMPAMARLIHRHHKPRKEVMELVEEAKSRGIKLAIYSDYGYVEEKLEALGSEPCARRLLEMLEADPETTLFVGDREDKDGASARAVGAKFLKV